MGVPYANPTQLPLDVFEPAEVPNRWSSQGNTTHERPDDLLPDSDHTAALEVQIPHFAELDILTSDPAFRPAFDYVASRSTITVALYCGYAFMGWPDIEAYQMATGSQATSIPSAFRNSARPHLAYLISRLLPNRLWTFSRLRDLVDDPATDPTIKASLLRFLAQHIIEGDRVSLAQAQSQAQPSTLSLSSPALMAGLRDSINDAIMRQGAVVIVPPEPKPRTYIERETIPEAESSSP